ncbi:MAG: hypothetical protein JWR07_5199, partial [Nevskia sp.]|nr:hypothetical protein [Nevskia sp.]
LQESADGKGKSQSKNLVAEFRSISKYL